jgi:hypothetical protein
MKIVCDIDGVLCDEEDPVVSQRNPYMDRIAILNGMVDRGYTLDIYTSRGMKSSNNDPIMSDRKYRMVTEQQLSFWGVKYTNLFFGKPNADIYIDNKNVTMSDFFDMLGNAGSNSNS